MNEGQIRRVRCIALAVCFLATAVAARAAAQVSVDQVELVLAPHSVTQSTAVFNATNDGDKPIQVKISLGDWDRSAEGQNRFFDLGTQQGSCGNMVGIFPKDAVVDPHVSQPIRVTLQNADSLKTACWVIAYVETVQPPALAVGGTQIVYVIRTGVKVYIEPNGLQKDGAIEDVDVVPHVKKPGITADTLRQDLDIGFRNTGGLPLQVHGTVEFRRTDNSLAATVPVDEFGILPGALRRVIQPVPALIAGRYIALVLLDFGGREIAAGQVDFQVR